MEFFLEEHWLKGIHTNEDEGKHEVMNETANKILPIDFLVEGNPIETSFWSLLF